MTIISRIALAFFLTIFIIESVTAQGIQYTPGLVDSAKVEMLKYRAEIEKRLPDIKDKSNQEYTKYINEIRGAQRKLLLRYIDSGMVVYDPVLYNYVDNVFSHILASNNLQRKDYVLLIVKDGVPNAYNFGKGVVVLNLGLMPYFSNVYQLAMVLSHELAHDLGNHVEHSCKKNFDILHSDKLKGELEEIKESEYNASIKLRKLLKNYGLNVNKHSRDNEFEADSVGFRMYEKTGYFKMEAVEMLVRLDSVDIPFYKGTYNMAQILGSAEYPYRKAWEYYEEPIFAEVADEGDTMKTHPDCIKRIAAVFDLIEKNNKDPEFHDAEYAKMINRCEWLMLEGALRSQNYGEAFYRSLEMIRRYPKDQQLYEILVFTIHQVYVFQGNHDLDKVVSLPGSVKRDNYDHCLTILHNLTLNDLLKIGYNVSAQFNQKNHYQNYNMLSYQISFATKLANTTKVSELNHLCVSKFSAKGNCNQFEKPMLTIK